MTVAHTRRGDAFRLPAQLADDAKLAVVANDLYVVLVKSMGFNVEAMDLMEITTTAL